jgi:diguanylate cyclase (GGDEF)-like protein
MNSIPDPHDAAVASAESDLVRLQGQVDAMRAVLVRLLQDVVVAEKRLGASESSQLLEANEQLVVTAMRNQFDAETASQALDHAQRVAELDALTQLPNRMLLLDRLNGAIAIAKRYGTQLAVLFVDIDKFKEINDTLGHTVGDEALKFVAQCLVSSVRAADTVSRHGGDEFVVLLAEVSNGSDAMLVAQKTRALLGAPNQIGSHALRLSASFGISLYPEHGEDATTLIEHADTAMYQAKRRGAGSCVFYGEGVGDHTSRLEGRPAPASARPLHALPALQGWQSFHAELQEANEQLVLSALGAQELQEAMHEAQQRQTEFLTLVASELSDPLAPIRLAAEQLGRLPSDEALLPLAQALIETQASHMKRLVNDLLDMSHHYSGRLRFKRECVNVIGIVESAIQSIQPLVTARAQTLVHHRSSTALEVLGSASHLRQVIGNLLDNACRHTPHGGEINITTARVGKHIVITVKDNGLGLTQEALRQVFRPFVQDPRVIGVKGVGLGIGLTVVKELVEAHGGTVLVSSQGRGLGSQFVVSLPVSGA